MEIDRCTNIIYTLTLELIDNYWAVYDQYFLMCVKIFLEDLEPMKLAVIGNKKKLDCPNSKIEMTSNQQAHESRTKTPGFKLQAASLCKMQVTINKKIYKLCKKFVVYSPKVQNTHNMSHYH